MPSTGWTVTQCCRKAAVASRRWQNISWVTTPRKSALRTCCLMRGRSHRWIRVSLSLSLSLSWWLSLSLARARARMYSFLGCLSLQMYVYVCIDTYCLSVSVSHSRHTHIDITRICALTHTICTQTKISLVQIAYSKQLLVWCFLLCMPQIERPLPSYFNIQTHQYIYTRYIFPIPH